MDRTHLDSALAEDMSRPSTVSRGVVYQHYRAFRSGQLSGYVHKEFAEESLRTLLPGLLTSPPSSAKVRYRSYLNRDLFRVTVSIRGTQQILCLKSVRCKSMWRMIFIDNIMPSRIIRYLTVAETLKSLHIETPAVIAVAEERRRFGVGRSFVLTRWCENTVTLADLATATAIRDRSRTESHARKAMIDGLAKMIRLLHRHRIFHMDLKPDNILVREGRSGMPSLILVDLDPTVIVRRWTPLVATFFKWADLLILHKHFYPITRFKERVQFLTIYSMNTPSRRSLRRTRLFLLRSQVWITLYEWQREANLIHAFRGLLLCLRVLR